MFQPEFSRVLMGTQEKRLGRSRPHLHPWCKPLTDCAKPLEDTQLGMGDAGLPLALPCSDGDQVQQGATCLGGTTPQCAKSPVPGMSGPGFAPSTSRQGENPNTADSEGLGTAQAWEAPTCSYSLESTP